LSSVLNVNTVAVDLTSNLLKAPSADFDPILETAKRPSSDDPRDLNEKY